MKLTTTIACLLVALTILVGVSEVRASPNPSRLLEVIDGDTLKIKTFFNKKNPDGKEAIYCIRGAAAPSLRQPYGKQAQARLKELVADKALVFSGPVPRGYKKRSAARFFVDTECLAFAMVSEGLAWVVEGELVNKHAKPGTRNNLIPEGPALLKAQAEARNAERGLWADDNPIPPWLAQDTSDRPSKPQEEKEAAPKYVIDKVESKVIASKPGRYFGRCVLVEIPSDPVVWILFYHEASHHFKCKDGVVHIRFSRDYGETWSSEDQYFDNRPVTPFPAWPPGAEPESRDYPGEPWAYLAPNGDLVLHTLNRRTGPSAFNGTWQIRSRDRGKTWSIWSQLKVQGVKDSRRIQAIEDDIAVDGVIYQSAKETSNPFLPVRNILIRSRDNGVTWEKVSNITSFEENTNECGIEFLGNKTIIALIVDRTRKRNIQRLSHDMGATWSDVQAPAYRASGNVITIHRPRLRTLRHIRGETEWWLDPVLLVTSNANIMRGDDKNDRRRRNGIFISPDRGKTWQFPQWLDVETEDAGYGNTSWDPKRKKYVTWLYHGDHDEAVLKQYKFAVRTQGGNTQSTKPFIRASKRTTLADEKTDDLTTLTVEQAKDIVAQHKGTLSFRNLPNVDLDVARILSQYKGEVRLNGLKRLTPETAEALSRQPKAANLFLNGLTEITPEVARALAVRNGGMLSLNALTELSPEVAHELAQVYAKLALGGVRRLSVESARELAKCRSPKLTMMGLPEISDEAAEALTAMDRGVLLNGLTKLTSPVMVEVLLRKCDGFLSFKKVQTITDEVAAVLMAHDRKQPMALDSLIALPEKSAAALRASDKVVLPPHLRVPGVTNSQGMKLAYIPAGKFGMGSPGNEAGREAQERRHEVELTRAFYIGAHQVTVGQFRKFVNDAKCRTEGERDGKGGWGVNKKGSLEKDGRFTWSSPGFEQTDDHPVVLLSWNDANAYCRWLSKKENKTYRLPTEAEWEYACRAGTRTAYSFGEDAKDLATHGNVGGNKDGFRYTAPVGRFKPNRYGLYDMHGNVWEWCSDWYDPKGYARGTEIDPTGPASAEARVHRGAGWSSSATRARSASRIGRHPSTYRGCYLGFRVVLEGGTE